MARRFTKKQWEVNLMDGVPRTVQAVRIDDLVKDRDRDQRIEG